MAAMAMAMTRYTQARMAQMESFEDGPLAGFCRVERAMAEVEQELMRARGSLSRYEVAIRTAQKIMQEWRDAEMARVQYPWRR